MWEKETHGGTKGIHNGRVSEYSEVYANVDALCQPEIGVPAVLKGCPHADNNDGRGNHDCVGEEL